MSMSLVKNKAAREEVHVVPRQLLAWSRPDLANEREER